MGLLAAKQKRCEDAESLFRKSLEMREEWYGSSHPLVAEIYDALASLSCSDAAESPDVTVAEEMFRRALSMREDLLGPSHLLVSNTLFKLGQYRECFDIACIIEGIFLNFDWFTHGAVFVEYTEAVPERCPRAYEA